MTLHFHCLIILSMLCRLISISWISHFNLMIQLFKVYNTSYIFYCWWWPGVCIPGVWFRYARLITLQNELYLEANVSKLLVMLFYFFRVWTIDLVLITSLVSLSSPTKYIYLGPKRTLLLLKTELNAMYCDFVNKSVFNFLFYLHENIRTRQNHNQRIHAFT
jgi:hypothetical protein